MKLTVSFTLFALLAAKTAVWASPIPSYDFVNADLEVREEMLDELENLLLERSSNVVLQNAKNAFTKGRSDLKDQVIKQAKADPVKQGLSQQKIAYVASQQGSGTPAKTPSLLDKRPQPLKFGGSSKTVKRDVLDEFEDWLVERSSNVVLQNAKNAFTKGRSDLKDQVIKQAKADPVKQGLSQQKIAYVASQQGSGTPAKTPSLLDKRPQPLKFGASSVKTVKRDVLDEFEDWLVERSSNAILQNAKNAFTKGRTDLKDQVIKQAKAGPVKQGLSQQKLNYIASQQGPSVPPKSPSLLDKRPQPLSFGSSLGNKLNKRSLEFYDA